MSEAVLSTLEVQIYENNSELPLKLVRRYDFNKRKYIISYSFAWYGFKSQRYKK